MVGNDWDIVLSDIFDSGEFQNFYKSLLNIYDSEVVYPSKEDIFRALKLTSFNDVKVVVVGQDPYHGEGEANGLSFSVSKGIRIPPSLKNIFKELHDDLGIEIPDNGDLTKWAREGVLMLNAVLTVLKDKPASHKNLGWEKFTDYVIKTLNLKETPVVFILWGNFAKEKSALITNKKHLVITSVHPSPFSARNGFFGSKPFSKTNDFLINNNIKPIDWKL